MTAPLKFEKETASIIEVVKRYLHEFTFDQLQELDMLIMSECLSRDPEYINFYSEDSNHE